MSNISKKPRGNQHTFYTWSAPELTNALNELQADPTVNFSAVMRELLDAPTRKKYPYLFPKNGK